MVTGPFSRRERILIQKREAPDVFEARWVLERLENIEEKGKELQVYMVLTPDRKVEKLEIGKSNIKPAVK